MDWLCYRHLGFLVFQCLRKLQKATNRNSKSLNNLTVSNEEHVITLYLRNF